MVVLTEPCPFTPASLARNVQEECRAQVAQPPPGLDTYRVWGSGMGREMHRKGSKVLLCFWQ